MYAPIVDEPTLMGPKFMPFWLTIVLPYMVGYPSIALATTYTSLAPPTDFPLGNSGSLSFCYGYMGNVRQPFKLQVMTKLQGVIGDLLKANSCLIEAPTQSIISW